VRFELLLGRREATIFDGILDRILAAIPFKGQVLNLASAWWFDKTKSIVNNAVISTSDPNFVVAKKVEVFPVEFVVRGYITGSTDTSLWTHYNKGSAYPFDIESESLSQLCPLTLQVYATIAESTSPMG
jgi:phosphoribosylaminoimidazole-succinocarboxamide synthase